MTPELESQLRTDGIDPVKFEEDSKAAAKKAALNAGTMKQPDAIGALVQAQRRNPRKCAVCHEELAPLEMMWCEKCLQSESVGEPEKHPRSITKVKQLDASWPRLHREMVGEYQGEAATKARAIWSSVLQEPGATIILHGERGRGKTGMVVQWATWRGEAGRSPGTYTTAVQFFAVLRRAWHPSSKESEFDSMRPFREASFLAIDQLHHARALTSPETEKMALWERATLVDLLDYRYRERKTTVIIATLNEAEISAALDPDIVERVRETGGMIDCKWESYR